MLLALCICIAFYNWLFCRQCSSDPNSEVLEMRKQRHWEVKSRVKSYGWSRRTFCWPRSPQDQKFSWLIFLLPCFLFFSLLSFPTFLFPLPFIPSPQIPVVHHKESGAEIGKGGSRMAYPLFFLKVMRSLSWHLCFSGASTPISSPPTGFLCLSIVSAPSHFSFLGAYFRPDAMPQPLIATGHPQLSPDILTLTVWSLTGNQLLPVWYQCEEVWKSLCLRGDRLWLLSYFFMLPPAPVTPFALKWWGFEE